MDVVPVIEEASRIAGIALLVWLLFVGFVTFRPLSYVVVVGLVGVLVLSALLSVHVHVRRTNDTDHSSAK